MTIAVNISPATVPSQHNAELAMCCMCTVGLEVWLDVYCVETEAESGSVKLLGSANMEPSLDLVGCVRRDQLCRKGQATTLELHCPVVVAFTQREAKKAMRSVYRAISGSCSV